MMDGWTQAGVGTPAQAGWNMLRESFASVYVQSNVTSKDPVAVGAPELGLRLYDGGDFWLLIAAPGGAKARVDDLDDDDVESGQVERRLKSATALLHQGVPPDQQGPICLQQCTDTTVASHWLVRKRKAGGIQLVSSNDTTQCLTVTGPHAIQSGGLDLLPCNATAPLQSWSLPSTPAITGALMSLATAAELAAVGVGTPSCACGKGNFVDINAHQGTAGTACQMYGGGGQHSGRKSNWGATRSSSRLAPSVSRECA